MAKQKETWLSVYIFHYGNANEVLKTFVHPIIQKWTGPWFFIRYWEGGHHIRLRLKAPVNEHKEIIAKLSIDDSFIKEIQQAEYEPEYHRYGNAQSVKWAEQHFECASKYILNWIVKCDKNQSVMIQAIKLHLALLFAIKWDHEVMINVCNFFLEGWLPRLFHKNDPKEVQRKFWLNQFKLAFGPVKEQITAAANQFWMGLNTNIADKEMEAYLSGTIAVMDLYSDAGFDQDKLFQVISSFMHMNNNRLGIPNNEEAYNMYCIIACLEFISDNNLHTS